jgi:hypothetical protein
VRWDRGTRSDEQAVLTAAQAPGWEIPEPDNPIDTTRQEDDTQQQEQDWANQGINNAHSVQAPGNEPNLVAEATWVRAEEELALLTDDSNRLTADPDYGDEICQTLDLVNKAISVGEIDPKNVTATVQWMAGISFSDGSQAPKDLAAIFNNAAGIFDTTYPGCGSTLDTIEWMIEQIQALFCPTGVTSG